MQGLDGLGLALGVRLELGRLRALARLDLLDVLEIRGGGVQGQLLGQQEVARVAVGDVAELKIGGSVVAIPVADSSSLMPCA